MDGFVGNKAKFKDGLSEAHLSELWQGISANLPASMTVDEARSIVDPENVRTMTLPVPTQYQGRALRAKVERDKKYPTGGKPPINPHHGKKPLTTKRYIYICVRLIVLIFNL
jgi:hypothetical protein